MKRFVIAVLAAGLLAGLGFVLAPDTSVAGKSPFVGHWTATDNDGSNLELTVHGGPRPTSVRISDDGSFNCGGSPATGVGKATLVDPDTIAVVFRVRCHDDRSRTQVGRTFDYRSDDTLRDNSGVVWSRS